MDEIKLRMSRVERIQTDMRNIRDPEELSDTIIRKPKNVWEKETE
jgi:hypothetical protein